MSARSKTYVRTWAALLALAAASFLLSRGTAHAWSGPLAFAIAACKATLIVAFFMHFTDYGPSARLALCTAVGLIVLLAGFMVADILTRDAPRRESQRQPEDVNPGSRVIGTFRSENFAR